MAETALSTQAAELSDEALIAGILGGETHLFEVIVRRHGRRLHRTAVSVLHDEHEAEDVVQESFFSAYLHLRQFEGKALFATWLTRIAFYNALARKARHRRENLVPTDPAELFATFVHRAPNPEDVAANRQYARVVQSAIGDLPPVYRDVLLMREVEELDTEQTAARLKISESNVKVRLHRARHMLRKLVDDLTRPDPWHLPQVSQPLPAGMQSGVN